MTFGSLRPYTWHMLQLSHEAMISCSDFHTILISLLRRQRMPDAFRFAQALHMEGGSLTDMLLLPTDLVNENAEFVIQARQLGRSQARA